MQRLTSYRGCKVYDYIAHSYMLHTAFSIERKQQWHDAKPYHNGWRRASVMRLAGQNDGSRLLGASLHISKCWQKCRNIKK